MSPVQLTCPVCQTAFSSYENRRTRRRFCSVACKFKGQVGTTVSDETRRKLVISHLGNRNTFGKHWRVSDEGRRHMSEGQNRLVALGTHNFWKGGIRKIQNKRNDPAYRQWVQRVKARDGMKCRLQDDYYCSGYLVAHHIKRWADFPDGRYDINNGVTLCQNHHPLRRADELALLPKLSALVATNVLTL